MKTLPMIRRLSPILGITFIDILGFSILIPLMPYFVKHFGASDLVVDTVQPWISGGLAVDNRGSRFSGLWTIVGDAETVAIGEPGELIGELVALSRRQIEHEREAGVGEAHAGTGEASQVVEIDDDLLAEARLRRRVQKHVARRHFNRLAGKLVLRFEHVAAKQRDRHALKASAFRNLERRLWIRRHAVNNRSW
jgi:hypothetical protein